MKILVLMPLDEQHVFAATAIYHYLPKYLQDRCFSLPMYRQYLRDCKLERSWEEAVVRTLYDSDKLLKVLTPKDDYILIGNASANMKFDAVFSFQDIDKAEPYDDKFLVKIRSIFGKNDKNIDNLIYNLHDEPESKRDLTNCKATAQFLADYIKTDTEAAIEQVKQRYNADVIKKYERKPINRGKGV